jgi:hemerythrin-like domain-containing protein
MAGKMPMPSSAVPGHRAPGVGFEQPFDMLSACHERVQRSLALMQRLCDHLAQHGWDGQAASAASDVMRYFDLAAPHHHQDEERHVFPPLLAQRDATLRAAVQRLQQDHAAMSADWPAARAALQRVAAHDPAAAWTPLTDTESAALARFANHYTQHIALEDGVVYPAAQALLPPEAQAAMGHEMRARRTAAPPHQGD